MVAAREIVDSKSTLFLVNLARYVVTFLTTLGIELTTKCCHISVFDDKRCQLVNKCHTLSYFNFRQRTFFFNLVAKLTTSRRVQFDHKRCWYAFDTECSQFAVWCYFSLGVLIVTNSRFSLSKFCCLLFEVRKRERQKERQFSLSIASLNLT